jgi:hypothetical protein
MSTETGRVPTTSRGCTKHGREEHLHFPGPDRKDIFVKSTDGPPSTSQPPTMTVYEDKNPSMFADSHEDGQVTVNSDVKFVRPRLIQIPKRD